MTKIIFVGQAPSRMGDGRPFSGPSGRRLASLMNFKDSESMRKAVGLTNIFEVPAVRRSSLSRQSTRRNAPGDVWDKKKAQGQGTHLIAKFRDDPDKVIVVACGHNVFRALTGMKAPLFGGVKLKHWGLEIWCFPHPSGASQFWNDPVNVRQASRFLRDLLDQAGIKGA